MENDSISKVSAPKWEQFILDCFRSPENSRFLQIHCGMAFLTPRLPDSCVLDETKAAPA